MLFLKLLSIALIAQNEQASNDVAALTQAQEEIVYNYADSLFQLLKQNDFSFVELDTADMPSNEKADWLNKISQHANVRSRFFPYLALMKVRYTADDYVYSVNCGFSRFQEDPNPNNLAKYYFVYTGILKLNPKDSSVTLMDSKLATQPDMLRKWFFYTISRFQFEEIIKYPQGHPAPPFFVPDFMEDEIPSKYKR